MIAKFLGLKTKGLTPHINTSKKCKNSIIDRKSQKKNSHQNKGL